MTDKVTFQFLFDLFSKIEPMIIIESFEKSPASKQGDNYTAMLYRIKLKGRKVCKKNEIWIKSIIYKCIPENTIRREAFKSDNLFKNEVIFYTKVMPLFHRFLETNLSPEYFKAVPHCYYAENNVIILEDLCANGFEMADRKKGLNFIQISTVLIELAKFHSLSLALKITNSDEFTSLIGENGIHEMLFVEENKEWYREYYKQATQNAFKMVSKELEKNQEKDKYLKAFSKFLYENFFEKMMELVTDNGILSVLCHGDCWTNNILFKHSKENDIFEVCFIDFQICRYGSLALDLANLIYCCTTRSLRESSLDIFLSKYFETLYNSLTELLKNTKQKKHELTNKEYLYKLFTNEFKRCSLFGLGLAIDIIPISTCDSKQAPDLYMDDSEGTMNIPVLTSNELCKNKMTNLVCELVENNIL